MPNPVRPRTHQYYEIGDVMSPGKKSQNRSPGKKPGRLFDIFDENPPATPTNNAAATPPAAGFMQTGGVAEPATPTETVCHSSATIRSAESPVSGDDIDALLLGEKRLTASDDEATVSDLGLDDEEIATARAVELPTAASFNSLYAMGFSGKDVLLALVAANGDRTVAAESLLSGIPGKGSEEANLGDPSSIPAQEDIHGHCDDDDDDNDDDDDYELGQEGRERLVVSKTQSKGFSEEETATILHIFRQDRMAALDLELEGPSAHAAAPPTRVFTNLTLPPQPSALPTTFSLSNSDYISPFTNGYVTTLPPVDPLLTNEPPTKESLKRPLDTSSDAAASRKKQKKGARAPTPPRYKGFTREEYMRRSFGELWKDEAL